MQPTLFLNSMANINTSQRNLCSLKCLLQLFGSNDVLSSTNQLLGVLSKHQISLKVTLKVMKLFNQYIKIYAHELILTFLFRDVSLRKVYTLSPTILPLSKTQGTHDSTKRISPKECAVFFLHIF